MLPKEISANCKYDLAKSVFYYWSSQRYGFSSKILCLLSMSPHMVEDKFQTIIDIFLEPQRITDLVLKKKIQIEEIVSDKSCMI